MPAASAYRRATVEARAFTTLARAGMIGIESPRTLGRIARSVRAYGPFSASSAIAAAKHGDRTAIVDDAGSLSFEQLEGRVNQLVRGWREHGIGADATIGILCRNGRTPLIAAFAAARLGARTVWLNSELAGPQCQDVCRREGVDHAVCDEQLAGRLDGLELRAGSLTTATANPADDELQALCARQADGPVAGPAKPGTMVLLTSGTTGQPKGAPRSDPRSLAIPAAFIGRLGLRPHEAMVVGPPLFHGTGLGPAMFSLALGGTTVLRQQFDATQCLDDVATAGASALILVPVMLGRIMALGSAAIAERDTSRLRVIMCGGSRLAGGLARAATDAFGDVLYNLYGSTEAALGTMATPQDLRDAPESVGRPMLGTRIRILDAAGRRLSTGTTGRIAIAAVSPFEGYTGGGSKPVIEGFMTTGDLGHLDAQGRLYIDGRDDEMIVSGGENVFPGEVEDVLIGHPDVAEAAVLGVDDDAFGQRLRAFVVARGGAQLTADDVKDHVRATLARYKVPRDVVFVDALPRTATGKVRKHEL